MIANLTQEKVAERREKILLAARWCFLNFGYAKTSFEDIAKRAKLSRTLIYRVFKDKEDIFTAVFAHWLLSRHPAAQQAAAGSGSPCERLFDVCRLMALEPWADMVGAPMGSEFFAICERVDSPIEAQHRKVALQCVATVLGSDEIAEVFLLALDGLMADEPSSAVLEQRTRILVARFVQERR
ncbi:TetR family transcriptional regulator [Burkholderia pseudomallei]|uniref:TetR/AcrR family transcriptional regulator n=1 Tax=Burkholderia pseudomallei TaxID=28450 RepID=UPI000F0626EE|nr:TetR/AcrR family transcriptional regulator [Burkholderia pseudomallei]CAJ2758536.1 TetR family transcriptional regulator [Burkholderia pseudomallei]VCJ92993.1 TetR family transcriptional regulator [Burkholderia pseudomallei]VCJ95330.1 TetR family transcriptional regulator [Burkholderia pseudomallei]VCJ95370.1 TetR family transcriptional regulator [Burkholderia pseudomallei]VCJ98153.1 TetR family transcriptional regulator [Burkholderia pseudomallei]